MGRARFVEFMKRAEKDWEKLPIVAHWLIMALVLAAVAWIDLRTGEKIILSVAYMVPVVGLTWFLGFRHGFIFSLLSIGVMFFVDVLLEHGGLLQVHQEINAALRLPIFTFVNFLVARVRTQHEELRSLALTDRLTGLANSRQAFIYLERELAAAQRKGTAFTLVSMDADHFKQVNDTWGHAAGDEVLRQVGSILHSGMRKTDLAARIGGDEFILALPETGRAEAKLLLERLRAQLVAVMKSMGYPVTFSLGGCTFIRPTKSAEALLQESDKVLYQVKRNGRNKLRIRAAARDA
jgi:diguanylate cyclase (GGDEF)-like protein